MNIYAIIYNNVVVNIIEYDAQPSNPPPGMEAGYSAVQLPTGAGVGFTYSNGIFTAPKPYPSWTLINNVWTPPVSYPDDNKFYKWDESTGSWTE
jgi:hypothetical protein